MIDRLTVNIDEQRLSFTTWSPFYGIHEDIMTVFDKVGRENNIDLYSRSGWQITVTDDTTVRGYRITVDWR